jgi:hypothetical protein
MRDMEALKTLGPAWWGAIAGAIAAGASLLPDSRLLGGAAGGVAMYLVARKLAAPCGCHGEATSSGTASSDIASSSSADRTVLSEARTSDCPDCLAGVF